MREPSRNAGASQRALFEAAAVETDECVIFLTEDGKRQYASLDDRSMLASRAAWIIRFGDPGDDVHVLHRCNGGSGAHGCVNYRHLYLGTHADNMLDASLARTNKLTEPDVLQIRKVGVIGDRAGHGSNTRELADRYGVARETILAVLNRVTWKHL